MVLPYLPGGSLYQKIESGPLPIEEALWIAAQVADGLAYLHDKDIIHRDLHPQNILFDEDSIPKIADLGSAQSKDLDIKLWYGQEKGIHPGRMEYLPPEAFAEGETPLRPLMPSADVYMLGAVLWEMLTGQLYYHKKGIRPSELNATLPAWLDELVMGMLAKKPDDRPRDGKVAAQKLNEALARLKRERQQRLEEIAGQACQAIEREDWASAELHIATLDQEGVEGQAQASVLRQQLEQANKKDQARQASPDQASENSHPPLVQKPFRRIGDWFATGWVLLAVVLLVCFFVFGINASQHSARLTAESSTRTAEASRTYVLAIPTFIGQRTQTTQAETALPTGTPTSPPATNTQAPTPFTPTRWSGSTHISSTPTPLSGSTQVSARDGMVLVYIPAGIFQMGFTDGDNDEQPVHSVFLDSFWIDRTEITNTMYALCVAAGACNTPENIESYTRNPYFGNPTFNNHPVLNVSWFDAQTYCTWAGRSLPTEAQWEYAARGTEEFIYPWGGVIDCYIANYHSNSKVCIGDTTEVGHYPSGASPFGVLDMAGNVWEWVADWYEYNYYSISPDSNPYGPDESNARVLRGGSWADESSILRSTNRYHSDPFGSSSLIGFRCAMTP